MIGRSRMSAVRYGAVICGPLLCVKRDQKEVKLWEPQENGEKNATREGEEEKNENITNVNDDYYYVRDFSLHIKASAGFYHVPQLNCKACTYVHATGAGSNV